MARKITIAIGLKVPKGKISKLRKEAGGGNVGKYAKVKKKAFAGPAGGAPAGSFPINTKKRAKAALAYARNAPNPSGIKRAVYKKYPSLAKRKKREKKS